MTEGNPSPARGRTTPNAMAWGCVAVAVGGTLLAVGVAVRPGLLAMAGGLVALAAVRAVRPGREWRVARGRTVDIALLLVGAVAISYLALTPGL